MEWKRDSRQDQTIEHGHGGKPLVGQDKGNQGFHECHESKHDGKREQCRNSEDFSDVSELSFGVVVEFGKDRISHARNGGLDNRAWNLLEFVCLRVVTQMLRGKNTSDDK